MNQKRELIQVGDLVRDTITKFDGVVVAITEWLNGCVRVTVQPKQLKDGKPIDTFVFDVEQLQVLKRAKPAAKVPTGGDRPSAIQRPDAKR